MMDLLHLLHIKQHCRDHMQKDYQLQIREHTNNQVFINNHSSINNPMLIHNHKTDSPQLIDKTQVLISDQLIP